MIDQPAPGLGASGPGRGRCVPLAPHLPGVSGEWRSPSTTGPTPRALRPSSRSSRAHGARATFFLVGEQVRRRPALAAEIVAAGHAVALHADRHRLQLRLHARALAEDLARGREAIESATGVQVTRHRPPYGIYSARRSGRDPGGGPRAAAVVALGQGLAQVHHPRPDRRPGHAGHRARRRDPPARCGFLQRPQSHRRTAAGASCDHQRAPAAGARYRPGCLTRLPP